MEVLQARIDSFKKSKKLKNPNKPSSSITVKWPHPLDFKANPETLADAGFFYNPSYEGQDSVTCYACDKELEGWEEDDDPYIIHWTKCGQTCCWAMVRCGLVIDMDKSNRFVFTDKTRLPTHKLMEKARFDTFDVGKGWIHDQVKNHAANSKMMARAGFVYTPQQRNDDLVTCLYCDTSLSGWDEDDDPMEEHRKRDKLCPFFSATVSETSNRSKSQSQSAKPPSKSKPPSRSTSKSKHRDILLATKTHDGDSDNDSDSSQSTKATIKTPRNGRSTGKSSSKTPKSKTRSSSKSSLKKVAEVKEEAEEEEESPHTTFKKKARSRSVARSEPEQSNAEGEIQKKALRSRSKATSSRSKSKAPPEPFEESEPVVVTPAPQEALAESRHQSQTPPNPFSDDPIIENHIPSPPLPNLSAARHVVEVSSDEEPEEPEKAGKVGPVTQSGQDNIHGSTAIEVASQSQPLPQPQPEPEVMIQSRKPEKSLTVEVVQPIEPQPSVPIVSPMREIEVVMADNIKPEPEPINHPVPSTPQRPLPPSPPKAITPPPKMVPSTAIELIPALSKLPITSLHALTEAELDMTVEEWVRYQMDVEYNKFKRDGERELQRFRKQAEEVRKTIEGL